ncbi:LAMI_0H03026g1_1 [Lachancea mirantina]|uniref:LAMI_0H03026g1_1 n=1 Tax=Lachancea mirantina TaxID=1230905 RepID=A0A1G4KE60_9SACH|nr:LAMI_0H03026g1_1 [Lachancea mirantina]
MSEEQEDLNLNELVGNLLAAHNESEPVQDLEHETADLNEEFPELQETSVEPGIDFGDEDLAAVVAQAIGGMDHVAENGSKPQQIGHEHRQDTGNEVLGESSELGEVNKEQEWAHILQQGLLQEQLPSTQDNVLSRAEATTAEDLDQEDEALRRAILDSLQHINVSGDGFAEGKKDQMQAEPTQASRSSKEKKASKSKSSKKSSKKKSSKKKKESSKKQKNVEKSSKTGKAEEKKADDDLLNFEDVIKSFMDQASLGSTSTSNLTEVDTRRAAQSYESSDPETQALVQATLKAFEKDLVDKSDKSSHASTSKKKSSLKGTEGHKKPAKSSTLKNKKSSKVQSTSTTVKSKGSSSKHKRKSSKAKAHVSSEPEDDDFSKALADMVNRVVNTSLTEPQGRQEPAVAPSGSLNDMAASAEIAGANATDQEEGFDLNLIMQNAMAMAFQDESQSESQREVSDDLNRELGDLNISDLLESIKVTKGRKKVASKKKQTSISEVTPTSKKAGASTKSQSRRVSNASRPGFGFTSQELSAALNAAGTSFSGLSGTLSFPTALKEEAQPGKLKKPGQSQISTEKLLRRKYSIAVNVAASVARKNIRKKNREARKKLLEARESARAERKRRKEEERVNKESERKELEVIVSRGPPYPSDLRLTKSGKPKKPYRRYTPEELAKRAAAPPAEEQKSQKIKRERKKREKKPKKIPLSALKKIPLFNFAKDKSLLETKGGLNDIDGTLARIPLKNSESKAGSVEINLSGETLRNSNSLQTSLTETRGDLGKSKASKPGPYDRAQKTVVHREKVPFHPPWIMPSQPPFALPVARRKKKDRSKGHSHARRASKSLRSSHSRRNNSTFVSGNKIIPAAFFPIINTLKAAARSKTAAGATPEEASRHLGLMLRQASTTIAHVLAAARGHSKRDYASIRSQDEIKKLQEEDQEIKRIPLFGISSSKAAGKPAITDNEDSVARVLKISHSPRTTTEPRPELESTSESINIPDEEKEKSEVFSAAPAEDSSRKDSPLNATEKAHGKEAISNTHVSRDEKKPRFKDRTQPSAVEHLDSAYQVSIKLEADENAVPNMSQVKGHSAHSPSEAYLSPVINSDIEVTKESVRKSTFKEPLSSVKSDVLSTNLENMVRNQLGGKHEANASLPANFDTIISTAIADLVKPQAKPRKKYTKKSTPVLNIEGIVPPSLKVEVEAEERLPDVEVSYGDRKSGQPTALINAPVRPLNIMKTEEKGSRFHVPTTTAAGEALLASAMRRAKKHLDSESLVTLKKAVNNERKRKWREANAKKNKGHDLRARLKKRANALFGEQNSSEKSQWYDQEYAKRAVKLEEEPRELQVPSAEPTTSVSDPEILAIIADTLDKPEVAKAIEKEIVDEAGTMCNNKRGVKRQRGSHEMSFESSGVGQIHIQAGRFSQKAKHLPPVENTQELIDPTLIGSPKRQKNEIAADINRDLTDNIEKEVDGRNKRVISRGSLLKRPGYLNAESE